MLNPRPASPLSRMISSVIHSGFALPFIWASKVNSEDTFLIIPLAELTGFFLVDADRLSSFMTSSAGTFARTTVCRSVIVYGYLQTPSTDGQNTAVPPQRPKPANFADHSLDNQCRRPNYFWKYVLYTPIYIFMTTTVTAYRYRKGQRAGCCCVRTRLLIAATRSLLFFFSLNYKVPVGLLGAGTRKAADCAAKFFCSLVGRLGDGMDGCNGQKCERNKIGRRFSYAKSLFVRTFASSGMF